MVKATSIVKEQAISSVGIIGGGELGQALGRAFHRQAITTEFYDIIDERSTVATIQELITGQQVILLCVPSWANRVVAKEIAREAKEPLVVISASKGVEDHFITMDQVLGDYLAENHVYGLLYGPMIAEEIAVGRQAAAVMGLSDMSWFDRLYQLFLQIKISTEPTSDLQGLAACGVLKNVYAIAFGMNDGLHLGDNAKGKLAVLVLREMKQLLIRLEADPQLANGLAGLGDLITTGITDASFNYRIGKTIAEGIADEGIKSEGLVTLKRLSEVTDLKPYPVLAALEQMIYRYQPTSQLATLLLAP